MVIVDDKLAGIAWPGRDAVGQRLKVDRFVVGESITEWATVVGVVEHVRNVDLSFEGLEQIYQPHFQSPRRSMKVAVKTPAAASAEASAGPRQAALVAAGLGLAWMLAPLLASVVFRIEVHDAATFIAVSGVALATAFVAAGLPARQAAAVEPIEALRD